MNTGAGMGCPIDLTDDQLKFVVGAAIRHEASGEVVSQSAS